MKALLVESGRTVSGLKRTSAAPDVDSAGAAGYGPQEWRCRTDSRGEFMGDEYHQDLLEQHHVEMVARGRI